MLNTRSGSSSSSADKIFNGVRFVLFGFDSVSEAQYRTELVRRGGTDVGKYDPSCTHVIVSCRVYNDPVCIAARQDGKILVTELWIDDSVDFGTLADASRVLYRPVKDLNGIPGSESLCICLTGYQKQGREDVMKMVSLMGARFSKPLIATQVTHLVCYKFEGEKYELAKKVKIKLVNHRWLEDCLTAWSILPIDNYTKSGWDLEVLEAEAKDSEEETEDPGTEFLGQKSFGGARCLRGEMSVAASSHVYTPNRRTSSIHQEAPTANPPHAADNLLANQRLSTPQKETRFEESPYKQNLDSNMEIGHHEAGCTAQTSGHQNQNLVKDGELSTPPDVNLPKKVALSSDALTSNMGSTSSRLDERYSTLYYSKRTPTLYLDDNVEIGHHEAGRTAQISGHQNQNLVKGGELSTPPDVNLPEKVALSSDALISNMCSTSSRRDERYSTSYYSTKTPEKEVMREELSKSCTGDLNEDISSGNLDISLVEARTDCKPNYFQSPTSRGALLQKRKVSDISIGSKSPKLAGQDLKLPPQSPSTNMGYARLEPTFATSVHRGHADASGPFEGVAQTKDDQHAAPSRFRFLSYKKRSFQHGQPTSETKISKSTDSPSIKNAQNGQSRDELDQSMGIKNKLSDETKSSGLMISPCEDLPSNVKPKRALDVDRSLEKTTSGLDSLVIDGRSRDVKPAEEEGLETFGGSGEPELVAKSETGSDIVMKDISKLIANGTGEQQARQQDGRAASPHSRDSETIKLSSTASTSICNGIGNIESSAMRIKKVASRRNLSCKPKLTTVKTNTDKGAATSDKATTSRKPDFKSAKEKSNAEMELEKADDNEKEKEAIESVAQDVVMEDKVSSKHHPFPESSNKKKDVDRMEESIDSVKENRPKENGILAFNTSSDHKSKVLCKESKNSRQGIKDIVRVKNNGDQTSSRARHVNPEPAWFILTGHRFQRKEFQTMIRCLRGRVCRDSHNWSYQATHLIIPDPVRRTEKFFAAAAAGRWILKTDYLTASKDAGKFLDEEPFEWYRKGLTEDGAINLEAPRKWRNLKEKTGHGALYGMRIIIYGECIAPTLDTLKRVVKAGDGTILATSPPYTRFLNSGVDFAIVSASMPRVDSWVQEFLRHKIPCVVADYLVEYVCKPGYSLERHVLYNTRSWAEKSFANLLSRSEEIVAVDPVPSQESTDDISCSICGSHDRGEVMLICGDEAGTIGCGIGTHIDCCNPPLEAVPEGDWFCPKCSKPKTPLRSSKRSSKCK